MSTGATPPRATPRRTTPPSSPGVIAIWAVFALLIALVSGVAVGVLLSGDASPAALPSQPRAEPVPPVAATSGVEPALTPPVASVLDPQDVPLGVLLPAARVSVREGLQPSLLSPCADDAGPQVELRAQMVTGGDLALTEQVTAYRTTGAPRAMEDYREALARCPTREYVADGVPLRDVFAVVDPPAVGDDRLLVAVVTETRQTGERVGGAAAVGVVRVGNGIGVLRVFGSGEPGLGTAGQAMVDAARLLCYYDEGCARPSPSAG